MSDKSSIEWTDASWNPIRGIQPNRHMCQKISPGCDNCYASTMTARFGGQEYRYGSVGKTRLDEKALMLPLSWREPRRVFVCSMTDLFGEWVPQEWIAQIFGVMAIASQHQYQVLTKRPAFMAQSMRFLRQRFVAESPFLQAVSLPPDYFKTRTEVGWALGRNPDLHWPLANVWLGTSIELDRYSWRANVLRECPAAVRFVSAEPLLGPLPSLDLTGIDWLIAGGESGAKHRPCEADWVRDLRDRSVESGSAFFFKQWGGRTHAKGGRLIDGRTWDEYPRSLVPV
jgi:protein gp37